MPVVGDGDRHSVDGRIIENAAEISDGLGSTPRARELLGHLFGGAQWT